MTAGKFVFVKQFPEILEAPSLSSPQIVQQYTVTYTERNVMVNG